MAMTAIERMKWQSILEMTGNMQILSEQQEWERLAALAVERQAALEAFFAAHNLSADEAEAIARGIQQILAVDRALLTVGEKSLAEIGAALHGLSSSRKAVQHYENCR